MEDFATAFGAADLVRVTDLYAASEEPIAGVDAAALARRIAAAGHPDAQYSGSLDASVAALAGEVRPGDLVVTLGAGSVTQAGPALMARLRGE
jgi:UDP-N-acetylmuramate--alanine ligase